MRSFWTNKPVHAGIPVLILAAAMLFIGISLAGDEDRNVRAPHDYSYVIATASNGMELHYLQTRPSNITLEAVHNNVTSTPFYGINGGFFFEENLLSIGVVNNIPVNEENGGFGNGGANVKYPRGTLVWDGVLDRLSVQVAGDASGLQVADRLHYWAQGGISMSLDHNDQWAGQAIAENAPFADEDHLRSAAVYDQEGFLYLVVSSTQGPLSSFREAIIEQVGGGRLLNGIFLDGDGSSQLRCSEAELRGDGRPVVQMIRILK